MKLGFFSMGLPRDHCAHPATALQCIAALRGSERVCLIGMTEDRTAAFAGMLAGQGVAWGRNLDAACAGLNAKDWTEMRFNLDHREGGVEQDAAANQQYLARLRLRPWEPITHSLALGFGHGNRQSTPR